MMAPIYPLYVRDVSGKIMYANGMKVYDSNQTNFVRPAFVGNAVRDNEVNRRQNYTDFITGEYRYDNLANMEVGEEVRLVYVPKALPNGEVDHSVEELAATDLYGSNELGIISAEDEKEHKARFIVTIPLICKLETLEWENEDDNSTVSATIKAYDYEFNYDE